MLAVMIPLVAVAVLAVFVYVARERMGLEGLGLAALRTAGLGALIVLFLNPGRTARVTGEAPIVLLDASLSMDVAGGRWREALDTARSRAGTEGRLLRFGTAVAPFDTIPAGDGRSRLASALGIARAANRPVVVVTDGEIEDAESMAGSLLDGVSFIVLPRDTVLNASLLSVESISRAERGDSISISAAVALWGAEQEQSARLEVYRAERRIASLETTIPTAPSVARRQVILPPGVLPTGVHVLRVRVTVNGDREPRDDQRFVILEVSEQPAVVVVVDPADWEGRFLVRELADIVRTPLRGYARIGDDRWLDMETLTPAVTSVVTSAVRGAGLLLVRGGAEGLQSASRRQAVWYWPGGSDDRSEFFAGDWYLTGAAVSSPVAAGLARVEWDSLPPLTGLVPLVAGASDWVALTARQGRRGPERPILIGRDSAGVRTLVTAGAGLWRWAFRGGAAREAYRTLLATGSDWLLGSNALSRRTPLSASATVARGEPIVFRWDGAPIPDSLVVRVAHSARPDTTAVLRFGSDGVALFNSPVGTAQWSVPGDARLRGVSVVEEYSTEFAPHRVWIPEDRDGQIFRLVERFAREYWWLFVFAVVAFAGEWAWRYQRGLP